MENSADSVRPLLYVSFDRVPAAKGASTHIEANARAVGARYGSLVLVTPGPRDEPVSDFAPGVRQVVLGCPDRDVLGRVMTFRTKLDALLARQTFDLIHFRSTFEGYRLARDRGRHGAALLYEVNGLPSVELPHAHPRIRGDALLAARLRHQEDVCLREADHIVTVSAVSRQYLIGRGADPAKISVIPNGVDTDLFSPPERPPTPGPPLRVLYCGTLSAWQGVDTLLDAVALARSRIPVRLSVVGPAPRDRHDASARRIQRLGLTDAVTLHGAQPRARVAELLCEHHVAAVPLSATDRNVLQGCCPLKLLEAAAAGCPLVASDLPVVRELLTPHAHYLPVAPDDPAALAEALCAIAADPGAARNRAARAREHVAKNWTWKRSTDRLLAVYEALLATAASSPARFRSSTSGE
jgi:glycosyltransferase involved in cell wall biosynthesis